MISRDTVTIVGQSVLVQGATIARAVADGFEPCVIIWASSTPAAVHTGFTVHQPLTPEDVAALLRKCADDIIARADSLPREDCPLPLQEQKDGLARPDDGIGSDNIFGGG